MRQSPETSLRVEAERTLEADLPDSVVRQAQAGDEAAFARLYDRHAGRVYALCLRMSGDSVEAASLTQDAFVRAWTTLASFRGDSAFGSWLYRLAVNVVLSVRRSADRRERRIEPWGDPGLIPAAVPAPEVESGLDLERAIAALPDGARTVLVLYDIEGYTHEEIAEICGIAPGTSKAQLHRARRMLRERLDR